MEKHRISVKVRNDMLLVGIILLIAAAVFCIYKLNSVEGTVVHVLVAGENKYTFPLNEDLEKKIITVNGENVILIKDGKVSVKSADCPDRICVKHRFISKNGETIVCLPHKIVVEVSDEG